MKAKSGIIFIVGGARSGKSSFAQSLAKKFGSRVVYLATAVAVDEEMQERIDNHRRLRPAGWVTVEETRDLVKALKKIPDNTSAVLLDCLTLWLNNMILDGREDELAEPDFYRRKEAGVMEYLEQFLCYCTQLPCPVIVVSNEVGLGIVPEYPLARFFRDLAGRVNRRLAAEAREVYLMAVGVPLKIKGEECEFHGTY